MAREHWLGLPLAPQQIYNRDGFLPLFFETSKLPFLVLFPFLLLLLFPGKLIESWREDRMGGRFLRLLGLTWNSFLKRKSFKKEICGQKYLIYTKSSIYQQIHFDIASTSSLPITKA